MKFKRKTDNVWDNVWKSDVYSDPELRKVKAKRKVENLLNHVKINSSTTILDLGCGGGYVTRELYNKTGAKIYGIDNSEEAIKLSKDKSKDLPVIYKKCDITNLTYSDNFADVVLCIGVLEHIQNYEICLSEIKRVLKNNGVLYVVSSNKNSFIYQQRIIRQKLGLWNYGYQKNWEMKDLENIFSAHDFCMQHMNVGSGIENFKFVDKLDKLFSTSTNEKGRYIYYIGRIKK